MVTLSSCPWLASGEQPPDSVLTSRTLGAPGFAVSTLLSSVLTKLQLGFLSSLGGGQGENKKTVEDTLSFASSKGILQYSLCPPLQTLPNSRVTGWKFGIVMALLLVAGDEAKWWFLCHSQGFFPVPIPQNLSTGIKTKNEHCTQLNSYNNNKKYLKS